MEGINKQLEIIEKMVSKYGNSPELNNIIYKLKEKLEKMEDIQKQIESLGKAQESLSQLKFNEEDFENACYNDNIDDLREVLHMFSNPFSEESEESFRDMKEDPFDEDDTEEENGHIRALIESFEVDKICGVIPKFVYEMCNNDPSRPITIMDSNHKLLYDIKSGDTGRKITILANIPNEKRKHWTYELV